MKALHLPTMTRLNHCVALFVLALNTLVFSLPSHAKEQINLAVAGNFKATAQKLVKAYQAQSENIHINISSASTGTLFFQIKHGAPFDIFFAADSLRPQTLESDGLGHQRFTYAQGVLALWTPQGANQDIKTQILASPRISIANPRTAPYGLAAQQSLQALELWEESQAQLVRGSNVAQAYQFTASGHAASAFVALAQLHDVSSDEYTIIPQEFYAAIAQQAVLLKPSNAAALGFYAYLQGPQAREIILKDGYR